MTVNKMKRQKESAFANKVMSLSQDIINAASGGKVVPPKPVGIGITIHQATRCKELVNLLHAAGHSISYDKVRQVENTCYQRTGGLNLW